MNGFQRLSRATLFCSILAGGCLIGMMSSQGRAEDPKKPAVNYDDHIKPIFRDHCLSCHNQNRARGGLALDNFAAAMEGGSSGEVVFDDDLDSSRLWALVSHAEEPAMPPMAEKLPDAKLELIKQWILTGLLENSGSKARKKQGITAGLATPTVSGKPEGPAAMPTGILQQPVVASARAAAVSALATSPWAPVAAVAGHRQVVLYNTDNGQSLGVLPFPEGIPHVLKFSRNGELLLVAGGRGGHSGCAVLFDVRTGRRLLKVGDELDAVLAADINDDHSRIALAGPQKIVRIYSTATGELEHEIRKHTDWVLSLRFSPDGVLLATADRSNGLFVWEAETAREYLTLKGHAGPIWDVDWRPDSNVLASAGQDGTLRLWEMNNGKEIKKWTAHGGGVCAVSFNHQGQLATAGYDKTCKVWQGDGKAIKTMPAFTEPALKAAFTHNGERVISGDWTGRVEMWQVADAKPVASLPPNPPALASRVESWQQRLAELLPVMKKAQTQFANAQTNQSALEKKMADAEAVLGQHRSTVQATQQKLAETNQQIAALTEQVNADTKKLDEVNTVSQQLTASMTDQQKGLVTLQQQLQAAQQRLDEMKVAGDAANQKSVQAAGEVTRRETEARQSQRLHTATVRVHKKVSAELATLQGQLETAPAEQKQDLLAVISEWNDIVKRAAQRKNDTEKLAGASLAAHGQAQQQAAAMAQIAQQAETARKQATANQQQAQLAVQTSTKKLTQTQVDLDKDTQSRNQLQQQRDARAAQLKAMKTDAPQLAANLKKQQADMATSRTAAEAGKKSLGDYQKTLADAKQHWEQQQISYQDTNNQVAFWKNELDRFQSRTSELQQQVDQARQQTSELQTKLDQLKSTEAQATAAAGDQDKQLQTMMAQLKTLQQQVDNLQKQRQEQGAKIKEMQSQGQAVQADLEKTEQTAEEQQQALEFLRKAYDLGQG